MAYNYEYPYTDPGRYNADWLLNKVKELSDIVELKFDEAVREYLINELNDMFADVTYIPESKTIRFFLGIVGDGEHLYNPNSETMTII